MMRTYFDEFRMNPAMSSNAFSLDFGYSRRIFCRQVLRLEHLSQ
jgi:hypothetical protein